MTFDTFNRRPRRAGRALMVGALALSLTDVMFAGKVVGETTPDTGEQTLGLMMAGIAA